MEEAANHPLTADLASKAGGQHGIIAKHKYDETPCPCDPEPAAAEIAETKKGARLLIWRLFEIWGGRWGSNPRQRESQSRALPTELRPPYCVTKKPNHFFVELQPGQAAWLKSCLVRMKRLELLRLAALEPKSSVSTNSTTSAG